MHSSKRWILKRISLIPRDFLWVGLLSIAIGTGFGLHKRLKSSASDNPESSSSLVPERRHQRDSRRKSIDEVKLAQREQQLEEAGAYSKSDPGRLQLLSNGGKLNEELTKSLGLNGSRADIEDAIASARNKASANMARRLQEDPRKTERPPEGWHSYRIPGDPDSSARLISDLRDNLEAATDKEKMNVIMSMIDSSSQIAFFGRSDVYIQIPGESNTDSLVAKIQFYDPVTGTRLGGSDLSEPEELKDILGPAVYDLFYDSSKQ